MELQTATEGNLMKKLQHGDKVRVVKSLLYTGRTGVLGPISDDPDDPWDFTVKLTAGDPDSTSRIEQARTIGVHDDQVVPL
jgi:hypothetical protein